jgi:hypothetical protein
VEKQKLWRIMRSELFGFLEAGAEKEPPREVISNESSGDQRPPGDFCICQKKEGLSEGLTPQKSE